MTHFAYDFVMQLLNEQACENRDVLYVCLGAAVFADLLTEVTQSLNFQGSKISKTRELLLCGIPVKLDVQMHEFEGAAVVRM